MLRLMPLAIAVVSLLAGRAEAVLLGPITGPVDHASAVVWLRSDDAAELAIRVVGPDDAEVHAARLTPSADHDWCVSCPVSGLRPDTPYRCVVAAADGEPRGECGFRTAAAPDAPSRCSLAIGSCASEKFPGVWERMAREGAELVVLAGDTPYIDTSDLAVNRRRHREFLSQPGLTDLLRTRSFVGTWDDHDFGGNDSDGRRVDRDTIRRVFLEYRPLASAGEEGQGIYTTVRRGPVEVFLLDARFFAQTEPSPVAADKPTLLGRRQWDWLRRSLADSTAPFKLLVTGMVWHDKPNREKDDWETYAHERDALFRSIGEQRIGGVVLVGGDVHVSLRLEHDSVATAGYTIPEFVSSPLHDRVIPTLVPTANPRLAWSAVEPNVFLLVEADSTGPDPTLVATWIRQDGTRLHAHRLTAGQLSGGDAWRR
jgi:alkaline phosphatase D